MKRRKRIKSDNQFERYLLKIKADESNGKIIEDQNGWPREGGNYVASEIAFITFDLGDFTFSWRRFKACRWPQMRVAECSFVDCVFEECVFDVSSFFLCSFIDTLFKDSFLHLQILFSKNEYDQVRFEDCNLDDCVFNEIGKNRGARHKRKFEVNFNRTTIRECIFCEVPLSNASIRNSHIFSSSFSNCLLSDTTIDGSNKTPGGAFNFIDLQTIKNSDHLPSIGLEKVFGVTESAIQEYIIPMLSEIKFQKVFISYSSVDHAFARNLSDALLNRGVVNYLFEKHALAGEDLQEIMKEKQREFDRVLFIASESSLKSRPCHTELTEARERQNKNWKKVFFPVRIDDYIFKVEKHKILDEDNQEEYWKNIQGLKKMVVQDFSAFRNSPTSGKDWDRALDKLITALKL